MSQEPTMTTEPPSFARVLQSNFRLSKTPHDSIDWLDSLARYVSRETLSSAFVEEPCHCGVIRLHVVDHLSIIHYTFLIFDFPDSVGDLPNWAENLMMISLILAWLTFLIAIVALTFFSIRNVLH